VTVLKPHSDPFPCPRTFVGIPNYKTIFPAKVLEGKDDVQTHSNRERYRHWVQTADKTLPTYERCLPKISVVMNKHIISKQLTQKSKKVVNHMYLMGTIYDINKEPN
jgi:hypothetical protein